MKVILSEIKNHLIDMQSRKHRVPNKMGAKSPTPRHSIIKIPKADS